MLLLTVEVVRMGLWAPSWERTGLESSAVVNKKPRLARVGSKLREVVVTTLQLVLVLELKLVFQTDRFELVFDGDSRSRFHSPN